MGSDFAQNQEARGSTVIWTQKYTGMNMEAMENKKVELGFTAYDTYGVCLPALQLLLRHTNKLTPALSLLLPAVIKCNKDHKIIEFSWICDPQVADGPKCAEMAAIMKEAQAADLKD